MELYKFTPSENMVLELAYEQGTECSDQIFCRMKGLDFSKPLSGLEICIDISDK